MLIEQTLENFNEQLRHQENLLIYHKDKIEEVKAEIDELQKAIGEISKLVK